MWAIYRKEMRQYLLTPLAWVVWVCFLFLMGWVFQLFVRRAVEGVFMGQGAERSLTDQMLPYFNFMRFLLVIAIPILSMRLFSEEKQTGTLELLFTYPLTEVQMIFGKLLSSLTVAGIMVGLTLPPFVLLSRYGYLDWYVLFCSYLGIMMLVLVALSIGIFASSVTASQAGAFFITLITLLALWLAAPLTDLANVGPVGRFVHELSLLDHYEDFNRGILNSSDLIFYLSLAAFFIFLTAKQLESRKWRGTS